MINLIPPKIKKERLNKAIIYEIIGGFAAVLIMILIFGIALSLYNQLLTKDLKKYQDTAYERNKKVSTYKDTENLVKKINLKLQKIEDVSASKITWSTILGSIAASTPKDVQIKTITTTRETKIISVAGTAIDRKAIASMKEMLEKNGNFANVTFSASTFNTTSKDYSFSLSFELKQTSAK